MHRSRLRLAAILIAVLIGTLMWRLFTIQVVDHEKHLRSARKMRGSTEPVTAYGGDIHLRDGVLVARDVVDYEIGIDPRFVPADKIPQVVQLVCDALGKSAEHRRERLRAALAKQAAGGEYVRVVTGASRHLVEEAESAISRLLSRKEMKGLIVEPRARRTYPRETLAANVVGVTDASGKGIEGIEKTMGPYLSRQDGRREVIKDAPQKTRIFKVGNLDVAPVGGYDVYLTIDSSLQAIVEEELEAGVRREKAEAGVFILFDCNSGDVLAMASYPSYDSGRFTEYPDEERKKRRSNRAIESLHEPGSVIKPFFAAYALDQGLCRREQPIRQLATSGVSWDGGRRARFGRRTVTDVHEHPDMTFEDAVVHSSNIGMAVLGLHLGRSRIMDVLDRFGLNRPTGIELPAEASWEPWVPPLRWNPLYSPVSVSFGYEVMVTPMQLCRAFAAVVNGGFLLKPRIVDRMVREGEIRRIPSRQVEGRAISEDTSRAMREILRQVVERGTAKWLKVEGFEFGGKTGTSDMAKGAAYTRRDYLASFEGFAPYENPQVVALCMIEKPRRGAIYGGVVAGPVVVQVFRRVFHVAGQMKLAMVGNAERD